jgi:hypothetical protein
VENTFKKEEYLAYSSGVALADDAGEVFAAGEKLT